MKMLRLGMIGMLLCMSSWLMAQDVVKTPQGIRLETSNGSCYGEVMFYSPSIVRVVKYAETGQSASERQSLSVVMAPQKVKFNLSQKGDDVEIKTSAMLLQVNKADGTLRFMDRGGRLLLAEKNAPVFSLHKEGADKGDYRISQTFTLDKEEAIYGLGQLQSGRMSQRNQTKYLIQSNLEDVVTFFQSVKGYGVYWDNYSPTTFTDNADGTTFDSEVGDFVDYYFMYGENADGVVAEMRELTGQVPMFPLWTYGFWQSKERYKSQNELVGVVQKYRELGVPLDGIIQDWQYWGNNYLWNAMEFLNSEFWNPQKMVDDIHAMHAHAMISVWSSFGPMTKPYRELEVGNMLLDFNTWPPSGSDKWPPVMDYPSGVRVYDAYHPQARDIYWKYLNKGIFSLGMDAWWMDSTDPDHLDIKPSDYDNLTYLGTFRKVRNAYPLMAVGGVYDHQRAVTSNKRVFILTRSAFAGQQRYGANTWTGDISASWDTFKRQIPAGLNFSLCGIPHWNTDIGGFFLGNYPDKTTDPDYRELHVRWMQFGTFCPMMRSHGADAAREIWQFGKKGEPYYDAIEKYIRLRYSLLPYIYSSSWEVTSRQASLLRALSMDFVSDKAVWDMGDEYMFGKAFLVCPVTDPMYTRMEGNVRVSDFTQVKTTEVYLPEGTDWYDYWTNEKLAGGQNIIREAPIDILPLYVREGSIVPIGPDVQYATEKPWDNLELRIYPGADGNFCLYEDEFDNYNYEQGAYTEIPMHWDDSSRTLTINTRKGAYKGMLEMRQFTLKTADGAEKTVTYTGKKVSVRL